MLEDGSRVGVIGGGPAGSFFAIFVQEMARAVGLEIELDVFEPRHFTHRGPAGCNHCGGIVSELLVQLLATEGISIPAEVIQRGIDSYMLHMDVGSVRIETPLQEKRIAAVYRGNGPRESHPIEVYGFDRFLQDLAVRKGARLVRSVVSGARRAGERIRLECPDGTSAEYDLLAVAAGVNSQLLDRLEGLGIRYRPPETVRTFICEFRLGEETVRDVFGNSMHVFLLDLPSLEFAALVPKGDFVTLCMLGKEIDERLVRSFLDAPEVRRCFPDAMPPAPACHCFPRINVRSAERPYADRVVVVGDAGVTRLYKDGIGAAYRTAKAAARTAVFQGISGEAFGAHYGPACRAIEADNAIGKGIFAVSHVAQRSRLARRAILRMTSEEQRGDDGRPMSGVLWDMFTGSAPYRDILLRTVRPGFVGSLAWNFAAGNWPFGNGSEKADG